MQIIYYRTSEDGKVVRYHLPPKGMTPEQIETEISKFNEKGDAKAYIYNIEEGSVEMFLYEQAQYRRRFPKEIIESALDAISEARDAVLCLEQEG